MKRQLFLSATVLSLLFSTFAYAAQTPTQTVQPGAQQCPAPPPAQLTPKQQKLLHDWPDLAHYHEANAALAPQSEANRVVFMGDSITEGWRLTEFFPGSPYINRGISGQTTPQMLVRFRPDVIALKPSVVVLLAGVNDIAGNTGPTTLEAIEDNLSSMVELAHANGIKVVLCSLLPAYDFPWHKGLQPAEKVMQLNEWIKSYAAAHQIVYVDYFTPMQDEVHGLKQELTYDGVHPTHAGYAVMQKLVEEGIKKALAQRSR